MSLKSPLTTTYKANNDLDRETILRDYRTMYMSREASLLGRREVLTGKAKFGIFGDGKELAQVAMAKVFQQGDIRSGYYRDQTFNFAAGLSNVSEFFAQLYADTDLENEPNSGGRQMNSHFATRLLNPDGSWKNLTDFGWNSADGSPTASQMPRMVGLALASKFYALRKDLSLPHNFSKEGKEVVFGTIGNASSAEGHFWETLNAVGVLQVPLVLSIWDDDFGISVPNKYQLMDSLSHMLEGFQRREGRRGYELFQVRGWDYPALIDTYRKAARFAREESVPCIIHVVEVTQPQGHSTSGSHERYKTPERLLWEKENDCLVKMRNWLLSEGIATEEEIVQAEKEEKLLIGQTRRASWANYLKPLLENRISLDAQLAAVEAAGIHAREMSLFRNTLQKLLDPKRRDLMDVAHRALIHLRDVQHPAVESLRNWRRNQFAAGNRLFGSNLHEETRYSALEVEEIPAVYGEKPELQNGFEILNHAFESILERDPRVVAFGEDVGKLGDVNQGFANLQERFGELRVFDTGIREATIMGQAIGLAQRGFRPIAEIQYLDYFIYGIQTLSDDAACLHYRTAGGQRAPIIIRTRGHRLEGIWHAGSPMSLLLSSLRGMYLCVPRNMTQATGMYNTLLKAEEPAVVVEVLNGYRLKEKVPANLTTFTVPLGTPEVLRKGADITLVTYGACVRLALEAAKQLSETGIDVEIIDVQTLLPFDRFGIIGDSLSKTNRILFLDEDVPGGASAYMLQEVLEKQKGYFHLDSAPRTLCSRPHRPAYGDDGDYWSKPQVADIFQAVYEMMHEADPEAYPMFF